MRTQIGSALSVDPDGGWWRQAVWSVDPTNFDAAAVGEAFTACYSDGSRHAEVSYYVMALGGNANGITTFGVEPLIVGPWAESGRDDFGFGRGTTPRAHDPGNDRLFYSMDEALLVARGLALQDVSWTFNGGVPLAAAELVTRRYVRA